MSQQDTNATFTEGRVVRDPEARGSNGTVAAFSVATNRSWTTDDGATWQEKVTFVDVSAFGFEAKTVLAKLKQGAPVFVEGRLDLNEWEAQDGSKRSKLQVIANKVTSPWFKMSQTELQAAQAALVARRNGRPAQAVEQEPTPEPEPTPAEVAAANIAAAITEAEEPVAVGATVTSDEIPF